MPWNYEYILKKVSLSRSTDIIRVYKLENELDFVFYIQSRRVGFVNFDSCIANTTGANTNITPLHATANRSVTPFPLKLRRLTVLN